MYFSFFLSRYIICYLFKQVTKFPIILHFRDVDKYIEGIHKDVITLSLPISPREVSFFISIKISKPRPFPTHTFI